MLTLLINDRTFSKDFLGGKGQMELSLEKGELKTDQPFPAGMEEVVRVSGSFGSELKFGEPGGLSCRVDLSSNLRSGIELIWPETSSRFLEEHSLPAIPPGKMGARLHLAGNADVNASGLMPAGPANFKFGIGAGAAVGYDRLALFDSGTKAGAMLTSLAAGLRLPQHCGSLDRIPDPGELLVFSYDGFLTFSAGLNWGYQLAGARGIEFDQLHAAVEYDLRVKSEVEFGCMLGGEYAVEARKGHDTNWIRITVRKKRDAKFDFAASFDMSVKTAPRDWMQSADEFIVSLLGANAKSGLELFRKIRKCADLDALEKLAGRMLIGRLQSLAQKWLGKALDQASVKDFLAIVTRAVEEYDNFESTAKAQLARIIQIYEDYLGESKLDVLEKSLERVAALSNKDSLSNLEDADAWSIIRKLARGDLFELLRNAPVFEEVADTAAKTLSFMRGGFAPEIRDLVHELKTSFEIDKIFDELKSYSSEDKLRKLADRKLQGVVEKLLGMAWDKIDQSNVANAAARIKGALDKAEKFKNVWYRNIVESMNRSAAVQLNYAYTRSRSDQALIDIEIDLSSEAGRQLFREAVHGDFSKVFGRQNLAYVITHHGQLSHSITKCTQLNINVFGWESRNLLEVLTKTENVIQSGPTGDIQIFATEAALRERHEKTGRCRTSEMVQSNFLMRFIGEAYLPADSGERTYLVRAINNMAAEYDLMVADNCTTVKEIRDYLALAETVGLIPSADALASELARQFPAENGGLGKVSVHYIVAFDNDGVRNAFTAPRRRILEIARDATMKLVRSAIVSGQPFTHDLTLIGLLYLDPKIRSKYEHEGYTAILNHDWAIQTPIGRRTLDRRLNHQIIRLLDMEYRVVRRLSRLDELVDEAMQSGSAVPEKELEAAARDFVECAADLGKMTSAWNRINSFFAVFDAIVCAGSSGKGYRESSMILEIEPAQGTRTTRYLAAGPLAKSGIVPVQMLRSLSEN